MKPVKIKTVKLSRRGERGYMAILPAVWGEDLKLSAGDKLNVYRDESDNLI